MDTNTANNHDESCQLDGLCSVAQTCQGYIYATGITIIQAGNALTMEGECIVEATCGYSDKFEQTEMASLRFGTVAGLPLVAVNNNQIPNELDSNNLTISYSGCTDLINKLNTEDTSNGDDFINYQVIDNGATCTVNYRVGQHRMRCLQPTCVTDLNRTYEFLPSAYTNIAGTQSA